MSADGEIDIHLGSSPNYIDSPAFLNTFSGMNLIGNNDTGRYDLSFGPSGGSPYTDYNAALAAYGSAKVLWFTAVLDSYGGADKTLNINEIGGAAGPEDATAAVPEPMSVLVWSTLALTVRAVVSHRRRPANA